MFNNEELKELTHILDGLYGQARDAILNGKPIPVLPDSLTQNGERVGVKISLYKITDESTEEPAAPIHFKDTGYTLDDIRIDYMRIAKALLRSEMSSGQQMEYALSVFEGLKALNDLDIL